MGCQRLWLWLAGDAEIVGVLSSRHSVTVIAPRCWWGCAQAVVGRQLDGTCMVMECTELDLEGLLRAGGGRAAAGRHLHGHGVHGE